MTDKAHDILAGLRASWHTVRRDGDKIMVGDAHTLTAEERQAIKDNREAILALLACEEMEAEPEPLDPWGKDERQAYTPQEWLERETTFASWLAWNGGVQ